LRYNPSPDGRHFGLEFADGGLNRQHGCPAGPDQHVVYEVETQVPLLLATDVAGLLRKVQAAERQEGTFVDVMRARERASGLLHRYLPERVQRRFRLSVEVAPGITAERDYGCVSAEFDPEKFAGAEFDPETRREVRAWSRFS
jgi:hypothetical protein